MKTPRELRTKYGKMNAPELSKVLLVGIREKILLHLALDISFGIRKEKKNAFRSHFLNY